MSMEYFFIGYNHEKSAQTPEGESGKPLVEQNIFPWLGGGAIGLGAGILGKILFDKLFGEGEKGEGESAGVDNAVRVSEGTLGGPIPEPPPSLSQQDLMLLKYYGMI